MRFPNRGGRVLLLLFGITLGPFLLVLPASAWLLWTLTPLQKFYLGTYTASSIEATQPRNRTSIRWVLKTAPGRKSVPLLPQDAIAGPNRKLPVSLSAQAVAEGWRGVVLGSPEKVPSSERLRCSGIRCTTARVSRASLAFPCSMDWWGHCPDAQPVWFVLDELASLNKLPQLHTAVTENRKYGNPVVLGFQGRSQMEKRYGQDAEAMLSQPATKVFFRTSEPRAAKWISEAIGEIEVERLKESRSMGLLRSKKSYAMEIATKPLVMASEIAGLDSHRAFIKQENRVVPVSFRLAKKRKKQPEFVERKMETPAPRKAAELPAPALAQTPPKKPVQNALPLIHAPAGRREGFVWDSSNEIE